MKRLIAIFGILFLLASLPGCSWLGWDDDDKKSDDYDPAKEKAKEDTKKPLPICPQVAVVREVGELRDYGGEKPADDQLVSAARMVSVKGDCSYEDNGIDVSFDVNFLAAKGPRLGGRRSSFPYFVAVADPDQNILNKEELTLDVHFSSSEKTTDPSESLHVFIPLGKNDQAKGPYYRVLMGFQLTKEQLDAVRAREPVTMK